MIDKSKNRVEMSGKKGGRKESKFFSINEWENLQIH